MGKEQIIIRKKGDEKNNFKTTVIVHVDSAERESLEQRYKKMSQKQLKGEKEFTLQFLDQLNPDSHISRAKWEVRLGVIDDALLERIGSY
jgi:hypothetical protein